MRRETNVGVRLISLGAVLQTRRCKRDNLGIIFHISFGAELQTRRCKRDTLGIIFHITCLKCML